MHRARLRVTHTTGFFRDLFLRDAAHGCGTGTQKSRLFVTHDEKSRLRHHKKEKVVFIPTGKHNFFFNIRPTHEGWSFCIKLRNNIPFDDEDIPLGKFVRSLTDPDKATAEQALNEFLDTGLYSQEQITFVKYIIDWLVQYGTLAHQEIAYDEFSGGMDVTEVFEDTSILFRRIMTVVDNINANVMPLAA